MDDTAWWLWVWKAVCMAILIAVSISDLRERRVPNKIIVPAIGISLLLMFITPGWRSGLLGAAVGAGFMLIPVVALGKKGGMGDVKLAFFMGLILGYPLIIPALIVAHLSASLLLIGVLFKKINRQTLIPFAPFLSIGTAIFLLGS
ncbi:MAG: A24 family peptidase [Ardenticatenaceae bacterium]|nr:A24 family peptidase [Ardenticatenaceae bacterium]